MESIAINPEMLYGRAEIPIIRGKCDFVTASYFLVGGAIGNDILCSGINLDKVQPEQRIIDIIKAAGGKIISGSDGIKAVMTGVMHGIEADAKGLIKIMPAIVTLLAFCKGESRIYNTSEIYRKNPQFIREIEAEFRHLGVDITAFSDCIFINGRQVLLSDGANARNNPYLAMAITIAASRCEGEILLYGTENIKSSEFTRFCKIYNEMGENI